MASLLTTKDFRYAVRRGLQLPPDVRLRKDTYSLVEVMDERVVRFTISTGAIDREGDTVAVGGWDTAAYLLNPVVLWAHRTDHMPIGKCVELGNDGTSLKAAVEFVPAGVPMVGPKAEAVLLLLRGGFLNATSVGFRPIEYEMANDRMEKDDYFPPYDFIKQELMEFSVVSIPCNPEALIEPAERRDSILPPQATLTGPAEDAERAARLAVEKLADEQGVANSAALRVAQKILSDNNKLRLRERLIVNL